MTHPRRTGLRLVALTVLLLATAAACGTPVADDRPAATAGPPTSAGAPSPDASAPPGGGAPSGAADRTILDARFDDVTEGPVTPTSFRREVGKATPREADYDAMTYERDPDGRVFVRTRLAAGRILARNDAPGDGNVLVVPLKEQDHDAACVTYDVRFSTGFEWSAGGKLPGLLGVAPGVSPGVPTGGGSTDRGWSGRVMWLGPSLSRTVRESGLPDLATTYLYHPGQAGRYGDDLYWGRGFADGVWHQVRQCYVLNTLGNADGVLDAWLDGIPVLHREDLVYRTDPDVHVTHLDWSVFRGGDTDQWAAGSDGDVDLADLRVTVP
ncbi:polysaccharide lyase [Microlunatus flavus]|uniref:Polysaccharide lyase 14 domain-containing protein n=1 Tax=Microlunatus flavus TaxID=1036181 RepID=A0A1H9N0N9_9ACTN|nr:hypothetical protein [Microlunatus flavus]SER29514.1 hypothetical protein SAMN05421756_11234 [Microlunatus flavus]